MFLTQIVQMVILGILLGGLYALMGIGLTLILGVSRIVNFAHGEFVMLAMYITFWLWTLAHIDPLISVLICFAILFFFGMGAQYTTVRPTLGGSPVMHIFTTGALAVAMRNLALFFWKADFRSVTTSYSSESLNCWGVMVAGPKLIALILILLISVGLFIFFKTTYLGKAIRATTQDRTAARLMGINTDRTTTIAFGIGSAFAGIAGAILMLVYYAFPEIGIHLIMVAFIVVVLGGLGNIFGALIAGFIVGISEVVSGIFLPTVLKETVYFFIFILVLLLKPSGLFGLGRGSEELGLK